MNPGSLNAADVSCSEKEKFIRITTSGKLKAWVSYSLHFLEDEREEKSLILHTFPPSVEPNVQPSQKITQSVNQQSASNALVIIPRLISVVEIIKREYIKVLQEKRSNRMNGLYQYNEIGTLEQLGVSVSRSTEDISPEDARSQQIMEALSGRNNLRQVQSPYLRVTLSTVERPDLIESGATFQTPYTRKLSRSAKAREKKREKKQAALSV